MGGGQGTATVEVLTAEVRVLMVGSRQITASVVRQLDRVGWQLVDAFGRVNAFNDGQMWLIGRHRDTGVLVVCEAPVQMDVFYIHEGVLPVDSINACKGAIKPGWATGYRRIRWLDGEVELHTAVLKRVACEVHIAKGHDACGWSVTLEAHRLMDDAWSEYQALRQRISDLRQLPLIVLAGLR